ncbi:unnamed protein product [Urochloa decumbens]|uniref:RING-type E3 ubiquitin transferase n=1 Tax=Urochloa decumbens TaxID=240449 RepID=A0ABC9B3G8_9POAL
MPPPPEEKPRPEPRPKPPKPKPKTGPEPKPRPGSERYWTPGPGGGAGTLPPDPIACAGSCAGACVLLPHCSQPPPASPAATVHISSSRLPTPLIALSASLLAVSAVLLLALLVHRLARRRRRRRLAAQNAALAAAHHDAEGGHVLAGGAAAAVEEDEEAGVHHVWYIRTKGLDERAIAAIAAVVYDAGSKKLGGAGEGDGGGDDGSCAVCLAEFRHGETLRLLPRCGHAFHRGCIDTWLRAHVNCPLCRAPVVQVSAAAAGEESSAPGGAPPERNPRGGGGGGGGGGGSVRAEEADRGGLPADRGVRRAASMVALPRRGGAGWPDASSFRAPASSSGREGDMTGLGKIMRLLKFSDSLQEMGGVGAGAGRSVSFGARSCQRLPARSGPSAGGVSSNEMPQRTG